MNNEFIRIFTSIDRNLDRIATALESKSIQAKRPEPQPSLTHDALPSLDGFRVILFYGKNFLTTKFVARAAAQKRQSAAICVDFRDPSDLPEAHPDYRARSKDSGYQTHIVLGWDMDTPPDPADALLSIVLLPIVDASVRVFDDGKWVLYKCPEMIVAQNGRLATGPR